MHEHYLAKIKFSTNSSFPIIRANAKAECKPNVKFYAKAQKGHIWLTWQLSGHF